MLGGGDSGGMLDLYLLSQRNLLLQEEKGIERRGPSTGY